MCLSYTGLHGGLEHNDRNEVNRRDVIYYVSGWLPSVFVYYEEIK
jgi:hypothetical protein